MEANNQKDRLEIDKLTGQFFNVFDNKNNRTPQLDNLRTIFIKEGIIISNNHAAPLVYNLDNFIKPRMEREQQEEQRNYLEMLLNDFAFMKNLEK